MALRVDQSIIMPLFSFFFFTFAWRRAPSPFDILGKVIFAICQSLGQRPSTGRKGLVIVVEFRKMQAMHYSPRWTTLDLEAWTVNKETEAWTFFLSLPIWSEA
jgi:hypothetical protein